MVTVAGIAALVGPALVGAAQPGIAATSWSVTLQHGGTAQSIATAGPAAPTNATAACTSARNTAEVTVAWAGVAQATSYTVLQSTTSPTTAFTAVASGITGPSWTSAPLAPATYTYEVVASVGSSWIGPASNSTASMTITSAGGGDTTCT